MTELWRDEETSNYYIIDKSNGNQKICNKFGEEPIEFKPYTTGFCQSRSIYNLAADSNYRVQPKKFDGYFQCPRPASHIPGARRPYTRDSKIYKPKRLPDNINSIPKPVSSLGFSRLCSDTSKRPPRSTTPVVANLNTQIITIDQLKHNSTAPLTQVKTASDILSQFNAQQQLIKGYQAPAEKISRTNVKGAFMVQYPTSNDLFLKERKMLETTNPVSFAKLKYMEQLDLKTLKQRREQRILKNKLNQT